MSAAAPSRTEAIIRKIRALRARAKDAASTEAEAAMAARKAAELLARHNLSLSEVDARAEGVQGLQWSTGSSKVPAAFYAAHGIETLCNVKLLHAPGQIDVVGAPADVEVAIYFLDLVHNACWACWRQYQRGGAFELARLMSRSSRALGSAFRKGVAIRLSERLVEFAASEREPAVEGVGTGRDLVLVKNEMIGAYVNARWKLKKHRGTLGDAVGFAAGHKAGDDVALHRGVGSARANRELIA